jgi:Sulfotransferase domain
MGGRPQLSGATLLGLMDVVRRVRHGKPIVVVSGLPRSGTSMAMKMLEAGGVPILTDGIRTADVSNPKGYYEFEPVKELDKGGEAAWLADARGKAVKIISFLLTYLPEAYDYKVIFMQRDLEENIASQNTMLINRGEKQEGDDAQLRKAYEDHLKSVHRFLSNRSCFSTLTLTYHEVVERPREAALRINEFLGGTLDVERMAAVADAGLYRNRRSVEARG